MKKSIVRALTCAASLAAVLSVTAANATADEPTGPAVTASKQAQADHGVAPVPKGYDRLADTPQGVAAQPKQDALETLYALYDEKFFGTRPGSTAGAAQTSDSQNLDERIADAQAAVEEFTGLPIDEVLPEPQPEVTPSGICSPMPGCTGEAYSLPLTHSTQSNCSWCGPASTAMALRSSGASEYSAADGKKMSQTLLASSAYLNTVNTPGGTTITKIPYALDKWAKIKATVFYAPSSASLPNILRVSLKGYERGVVFGTRENSNGNHYNNHPKSRAINHFIAGYGYTEYGGRASTVIRFQVRAATPPLSQRPTAWPRPQWQVSSVRME